MQRIEHREILLYVHVEASREFQHLVRPIRPRLLGGADIGDPRRKSAFGCIIVDRLDLAISIAFQSCLFRSLVLLCI